jgi:hypothetical protein
MISLAPHHPILSQKKVVKAIDFEGEHVNANRLMNQVSGKRKRGGQRLKERSIICRIDCEDGSSHSVLSCVKGTLVEINNQLLETPQLLSQEVSSQIFCRYIIVRA